MPKWSEYTQKSTPADADELMLYDASAKVNKRVLFSGIWNWILGKVNNRLAWTSAGIITGAVADLSKATESQKATIPKNAKEIFFWVCMYRDANGTESKKMPFQQYDTKYIGGAEIITGGYYYSPEYYACFQIRIDNYVCWLHKSWLKMIENGNEIDNSAIVKVYVYYR